MDRETFFTAVSDVFKSALDETLPGMRAVKCFRGMDIWDFVNAPALLKSSSDD